MIYLDDSNKLFSVFNIDEFNKLNTAIYDIAPSLFEYEITQLISNLESNIIFNKSNVQESLYIDNFIIYLGYDDNIYIELTINEEEYEAGSLW